jgi:hypothetical protein
MFKRRTVDICNKSASEKVTKNFIGDMRVVKDDKEIDLSFLNVNESV